jgi:hypothetical protein
MEIFIENICFVKDNIMSKYAALAKQAFISSLKKDDEEKKESELSTFTKTSENQNGGNENNLNQENTNIQYVNNPNDSIDKQSWKHF